MRGLLGLNEVLPRPGPVPRVRPCYVQVSLRHRPAYTLAYVSLSSGEKVFVERGGMAAMSDGFIVKASTGGKVSSAVARRALGSESMIFTAFEATISGAWLALSPALPGDIEVLEILGNGFLIQAGSLLCYSEGVNVSLRYGGVRSVLMHEGAVYLHASGEGSALICSYGAIERIEIGPHESLTVDTGHIVAFSDSMKFHIGALGSVSTAALSGEGIVAQFTGPGVVYIQTRAEQALRNWLSPERGHNNPR